MDRLRQRTVGPKMRRTWLVTTADIVAATGYCKRRVRDDIHYGKVDPRDLADLSRYVMGARLTGKMGVASFTTNKNEASSQLTTALPVLDFSTGQKEAKY